MNTMQCQQLIDEYLRWLKQEFAFAELEGSCQISTPFLDRHNDAIEVYIEKRNGLLYLTDDGYTLRDLRSTNMEFTTEKRKAHLTAVLNGFGVKLDNDEICVEASSEDFPQKNIICFRPFWRSTICSSWLKNMSSLSLKKM